MTYQAANNVTVYYLTQQDFEVIMGPLKVAFEGKSVTRSNAKDTSRKSMQSFKTRITYMEREVIGLHQLNQFNLVGRGAFGQVRLVQSKETKKIFALKVQSKRYIVKKGQKEHVLNEYRIVKEIEHPGILRIHCVMQDTQHLYFLLDLLPGECPCLSLCADLFPDRGCVVSRPSSLCMCIHI